MLFESLGDTLELPMNKLMDFHRPPARTVIPAVRYLCRSRHRIASSVSINRSVTTESALILSWIPRKVIPNSFLFAVVGISLSTVSFSSTKLLSYEGDCVVLPLLICYVVEYGVLT